MKIYFVHYQCYITISIVINVSFQFQSQCPFGQTCQNGGCMLGGIGGCTVSLYCLLHISSLHLCLI